MRAVSDKCLGLVVMALLLLGGPVAAVQAQTLRIGIASDPDALDPTVSRTVSGRQVFAAMCDKLVDIDDRLDLVPQLATAWHWQDDGRTLVLELRPGVRFHDGTMMDATAVAASLQRHLGMAGSTRKPEMGPVQSIDASGPLEVRMHMARPFAPLVAALSDRAGMIMPTEAAKLASADFAKAPVCAGPFRFARRIPLDRIELDRFPDYWDAGSIHLEHLTYLPIPDGSVRAVNLRGGALDIIEALQPADIAAVRADPKLAVTTGPSLASYYIAINVGAGARARTPLGQNALVREALDLAIDREALTKVVYDGLYIPGNQSVPPGNPFYTKSIPVPGRDVARARALLRQAGFERVPVQMIVPSISDYRQAGEVIQSMVAEAGFDMQVVTTETVTELQQWTAGDLESLLILWSGRTDIDANLYNFNACGMALNGGKYCNPKVDALLDAARSTTELPQRIADYDQAAQIYLAERPYIYLYHPVLIFGATRRLTGLRPIPDSLIRLQGMRLAGP